MIRLCGARNRKGGVCQRVTCPNGRCHLHGGHSTGARTPEGKHKQKMVNWKTGFYSKEAIAERKVFRHMVKNFENI